MNDDVSSDGGNGQPPRPSWRKPVGMLAILAIIMIWCILIASNAELIGQWPILVQAVVYIIAGIVWIFPVRPLLVWMETGKFK